MELAFLWNSPRLGLGVVGWVGGVNPLPGIPPGDRAATKLPRTYPKL